MFFHVDICTFLLSHTDPIMSQNCPHTEPCCPIMFLCCPQPCPYTSASMTFLILVLLPHCPVLFPMVSHAADHSVSHAVPTLTYNLTCTLLFHAVLTSSLILSYATPHSLTTIPIQCLHCSHTAPCCILSLAPCCPKIYSILFPHCVPNIHRLLSPPVPVLSSRLQHGLRGALGVGTCLPV